MNYFFILCRLSGENYIEFIEFKNKNRGNWSVTSETASIVCILVWTFIRVMHSPVQDFVLPEYYLVFNALILFQKQTLFVIKIVLFGPVFLINVLCKKCSCKKPKNPISTDYWRELGLDPVIDTSATERPA